MVKAGLLIVCDSGFNGLLASRILPQYAVDEAFGPGDFESRCRTHRRINTGMYRSIQLIDTIDTR